MIYSANGRGNHGPVDNVRFGENSYLVRVRS